MRAVLQRVQRARVTVDGETAGRIGEGLLILLGVAEGDGERDLEWIAEKLANLRIFPDAKGRMNYSVLDVKGEVLVVSQFTLLADLRKGRRPSFEGAMEPAKAREMCAGMVCRLRGVGLEVEEGVFGAAMEVELVNDGPVTIILDSKS